jgi:hypothetical protein
MTALSCRTVGDVSRGLDCGAATRGNLLVGGYIRSARRVSPSGNAPLTYGDIELEESLDPHEILVLDVRGRRLRSR